MPKNPDVEMLIAIAEKLKSDSTKVYEETVSDLISLNALLLSSWAQSYITSAFSPTVIAITCCHLLSPAVTVKCGALSGLPASKGD